MIALGIDPGTAICGFGVVALEGGRLRMVDAGVVRTAATETDGTRLVELHRALRALVSEHRPDVVAVERLFFQRNVQTAMAVGQARGVALLVAAEARLPIDEPTPNEVKLAVCGSGDADKRQVAEMVERLLAVSLAGVPDDATDALAVAIGAAYRSMSTARAVAPVIGSLRGEVMHLGPDHALIEVGGIGYRVVAGPALLAQLRPGTQARVFTHHLVREDQQALFGFASPEELAFFELLMTVSQVGPRLALAIMSAHPVTKLQLGIIGDDVDLFTSVSGVGRKTAQRDHPRAQGEGPRGGDRRRRCRRHRGLGRRRGARVARLHGLGGAEGGRRRGRWRRRRSTRASRPRSRSSPAAGEPAHVRAEAQSRRRTRPMRPNGGRGSA